MAPSSKFNLEGLKALPVPKEEPQKSVFGKFWEKYNEPLIDLAKDATGVDVRGGLRTLRDKLTTPESRKLGHTVSGNMLEGILPGLSYLAGGPENVGAAVEHKVVNTTPGEVAGLASMAGPGIITAPANALVAGNGIQNALDPTKSTLDRVLGGVDALGGGVGALHGLNEARQASKAATAAKVSAQAAGLNTQKGLRVAVKELEGAPAVKGRAMTGVSPEYAEKMRAVNQERLKNPGGEIAKSLHDSEEGWKGGVDKLPDGTLVEKRPSTAEYEKVAQQAEDMQEKRRIAHREADSQTVQKVEKTHEANMDNLNETLKKDVADQQKLQAQIDKEAEAAKKAQTQATQVANKKEGLVKKGTTVTETSKTVDKNGNEIRATDVYGKEKPKKEGTGQSPNGSRSVEPGFLNKNGNGGAPPAEPDAPVAPKPNGKGPKGGPNGNGNGNGLTPSHDEEAIFNELAADAMKQGYNGSYDDLRSAFDSKMQGARDLHQDMNDADLANDPKSILRRISALGGITEPTENAEFSALADKTGGKVRGVPSVIRKTGGKTADEMRHLLQSSGDFDHIQLDTPGDLHAAIKDAATRDYEPTSLASAAEGAGLKKGSKWWEAAAPEQAVEETAAPERRSAEVVDRRNPADVLPTGGRRSVDTAVEPTGVIGQRAGDIKEGSDLPPSVPPVVDLSDIEANTKAQDAAQKLGLQRPPESEPATFSPEGERLPDVGEVGPPADRRQMVQPEGVIGQRSTDVPEGADLTQLEPTADRRQAIQPPNVIGERAGDLSPEHEAIFQAASKKAQELAEAEKLGIPQEQLEAPASAGNYVPPSQQALAKAEDMLFGKAEEAPPNLGGEDIPPPAEPAPVPVKPAPKGPAGPTDVALPGLEDVQNVENPTPKVASVTPQLDLVPQEVKAVQGDLLKGEDIANAKAAKKFKGGKKPTTPPVDDIPESWKQFAEPAPEAPPEDLGGGPAPSPVEPPPTGPPAPTVVEPPAPKGGVSSGPYHDQLAKLWANYNGQKGTPAQIAKIQKQLRVSDLERMLSDRGVARPEPPATAPSGLRVGPETPAQPATFYESPVDAAQSHAALTVPEYKAASEAEKAAGIKGKDTPARKLGKGLQVAGKAVDRLENEATARGLTQDVNAIQSKPEGPIRTNFLDMLKKLATGEGGAVAPQFAARHALGAGLGAAAGYETDPFDNPTASTLVGAGLGAYGPELLSERGIPKLASMMGTNSSKIDNALGGLNQLHNTGLLSPLSVVKKAAGDVGGVTMAAITNPDKAPEILRQLLSREGLSGLKQAFKEGYLGPEVAQEAQSGLEGLTNKPWWNPEGRMMGGLTKATKHLLGESGFSVPEQRNFTLTAEPQYGPTKAIFNAVRSNKILQHFSPFARIGINRLERGWEYSPLGLLNAIGEKDPKMLDSIMRKAAAGTAIGGGIYAATPDNFVKEHPIGSSVAASAFGPLGIPALAAMAMKEGGVTPKNLKDAFKGSDETTFGKMMKNSAIAGHTIAQDIPGLRLIEELEAPKGFLRNYFSGYTNKFRPMATQPLGGLNPLADPEEPALTSRDNPDLSDTAQVFNRMLSNIPGVRSTLERKQVKLTSKPKFDLSKLR